MKMDIIKRNTMDYVTLPNLKHEMEYNAELEKKYYYTREELRSFLETIQDDDMAYPRFGCSPSQGARKRDYMPCIGRTWTSNISKSPLKRH